MSNKPVVRVRAGSRRFVDGMESLTHSTRGYVNSRSGLGTSRDLGAQGGFSYARLDPTQIEAAFRTSWAARKGVVVPAMDMFRQGWMIGANPEENTKVEKKWRQLKGDDAVLKCMIWARLHGGSGLYIHTKDEDLSEPLDLERTKRDGVEFLTAMPRYYLSAVEIETDPISPVFGLPKYYRVASSSQAGRPIHHSRIVRFVGNQTANLMGSVQEHWGDSVLEPAWQPLRDFSAGQAGIANIIQEAAIDVLSIKGFMDGIAGKEYEDAMLKRIQLVMDMKSLMNALIIDADDKYDKKTASFSNLDKIGMMHLQHVAAAFEMPMTKFLGQPPQGMNATGEGDERNYYDALSAHQEIYLKPNLEQVLSPVMEAVGVNSDALDITFNPLRQMTEKERSEINERNAKTIEVYDRTMAVPDGVTAAMARGVITESDQCWPGVKEAYEAYQDENGNLIGVIDPDSQGYGDVPLIGDAAPRTLYVARPVENAEEILSWAREQGFEKTVSANDLHVTIIYSRRAVDWMKAGHVWDYDGDEPLRVPEGGPRLVEPLGDKGAVVLHFASDALKWRHEDIRRRTGASHDFPDFQTHITITYDGKGLDYDKIEPYRGAILLGPEVFEELDLNWKDKVVEDALQPA